MARDLAERILQSEPVVRERQCGGWLVTTQQGDPICLGVTGATKEQALRRFGWTLIEWAELATPPAADTEDKGNGN